MSVSPLKNTKTSPMFFCLFLTFLSLAWFKTLSKWIMFSSAQRTLRAWRCFPASFLSSENLGFVQNQSTWRACLFSAQIPQHLLDVSLDLLSGSLKAWVLFKTFRQDTMSVLSAQKTKPPGNAFLPLFSGSQNSALLKNTQSRTSCLLLFSKQTSYFLDVLLALLSALNPELRSKSTVPGLCLFLCSKSASF